jgi:hypothetical protein
MIKTESEEVTRIRARLRKMSEEELLRYGQGCKYMCSENVNFGKPPLEAWTTQLKEARNGDAGIRRFH